MVNKNKFNIALDFATTINDSNLKKQLKNIINQITKAQKELQKNISDEIALSSLKKYESQFNTLYSTISTVAKKVEDLQNRFAKLNQQMPKIDNMSNLSKQLDAAEKQISKMEQTLDRYKEKYQSLGVEMPNVTKNTSFNEQKKQWDKQIQAIKKVKDLYDNLSKTLGSNIKISQPDLSQNIAGNLKTWQKELSNFDISLKELSNQYGVYGANIEQAFTGIGKKITTVTSKSTDEIVKLSEAGKALAQSLNLSEAEAFNVISERIGNARLTSYTSDKTGREFLKMNLFTDVEKQVNKANDILAKFQQGLKETGSTTYEDAKKVAESLDLEFDRIGDIYTNAAGEFETKFVLKQKNGFQEVTSSLKSYIADVQKLEDGTTKNIYGLTTGGSSTVVDTSSKALKDYENLLNKRFSLEQKIATAEKNNQTQTSKILNKELSDIDALIQKKEQLILEETKNNSAIKNSYETIQKKTQAQKELYNAQKQDNETAKQEEQYISDIITAYNNLNKAKANLYTVQHDPMSSSKSQQQAVVEVRNAMKEYQQLTKNIEKNSIALKENKTWTDAKATSDKNLQSQIDKVDKQTKKNNLSFENLSKRLQKVVNDVIQYRIAWESLDYISYGLRDSIELIRELDTAMTNIRMVTGETSKQARETINTYSELGKTLGTTTREVAEGSIEWLNCGSLKILLIARTSLEL